MVDATNVEKARPRFRWNPVSGATAYRLRIQSRVPEGKINAVTDVAVKTGAYLPPQPLADQRAKVTVRVAAICGGELSTETVSWFLIDTAVECRMGKVMDATKQGAATIAWQAVPEAKSYDVRAHRLADGKLLTSLETKTPSAKIDLGEPAVVSVRPSCAGGLGEAVYRVLAR